MFKYFYTYIFYFILCNNYCKYSSLIQCFDTAREFNKPFIIIIIMLVTKTNLKDTATRLEKSFVTIYVGIQS